MPRAGSGLAPWHAPYATGSWEQWAGREWALRQQARTVGQAAQGARLSGDVDNAPILIGQDAGLIDAVLPAAEVIQRMVAQAEEIITGRLRPMLRA